MKVTPSNISVPAGLIASLALFAAACTGSATVAETTNPPPSAPTSAAEPTSVAEPTAVDAPVTSVPQPTIPPVAEPTSEPEVSAPPPTVEFRTDSILGISADGRYAYAGTTSPWNSETPCDAEPMESLAAIDIDDGLAGVIVPIGAGLEQAGDVRQIKVGPDRRMAILSSCGPFSESTTWFQIADVGSDGRIVSVSDAIALTEGDRSGDPFLLGWTGDDSIEIHVVVEVDPDDFESWLVERRRLDISTGEVLGVEQSSYLDDDAFATRSSLTTAAGYTYRSVPDPNGSFGCEGFGVAQTLEVDDGSERRLALGPDNIVFSTVDELHMNDNGYIAWTSGCEGFTTAYVGKVLADGSIADAHFIETYFAGDGFIDYFSYRLTADDHLVAVGIDYGDDGDHEAPGFLRIDLSTDPNFVNTADPAPQIAAAPLFEAIDGDGSWHVGETLAEVPACGGSTLYGKTGSGFNRAFPAGFEVDSIIDVDLSETRSIEYNDGTTFTSRTVVLQTECPGSYEGRKLWFGVEAGPVVWGIAFAEADVAPVADVLAVRDQVEPGTSFVAASFVEVELLDGTVAEFELVAVPFDE